MKWVGDFFSFDYLITPRLISIIYALTVFMLLVFSVATINIWWLLAAIFIRFPFEYFIVVFKSNIYLKDLRDHLAPVEDKKQVAVEIAEQKKTNDEGDDSPWKRQR
ncbi:hypothetical protein [Kosakonia sacchari]|uniref:hypothetical protein n=1 Tax=Kosakonia sacchari TaxID=1158459 RepID=UPI0015854F80|nr:hypothetical protein [Kosakonia sacchari]NUL35038.1 hypothetical protein [Kosakonia sacchari]